MQLNLDEHEYTSVSGDFTLRQKVADLYNFLYRQDKSSKYTHENVSISGGGRIGLTRIVASLGNINLGHFLPDYTAYEEILSLFKAFVPIPILLDPEQGYHMPIDLIEKEILGRGLKALLLSNPCNPTGQVIMGKELEAFVNLCKYHECALILDEFYSHYLYPEKTDAANPPTVSAASYIEDVDQDPIIILDGLTKNWRYPGWRISWTLGPKSVIQTLSSVGSFLDGGANHPLQHEAIPLLEPAHMLQETRAIQHHFKLKRDYMLKRLTELGIEVAVPPQGTFYMWANLAKLPSPLDQGFAFFEACLKEKVITVPGIFFDVNPEKRRKTARYSQYVRISFGPEMDALVRGLDGIERVIKANLK
jgi:aspartate/methionine/tyrosine aminotransferase